MKELDQNRAILLFAPAQVCASDLLCCPSGPAACVGSRWDRQSVGHALSAGRMHGDRLLAKYAQSVGHRRSPGDQYFGSSVSDRLCRIPLWSALVVSSHVGRLAVLIPANYWPDAPQASLNGSRLTWGEGSRCRTRAPCVARSGRKTHLRWVPGRACRLLWLPGA